jgi:hypothetical protein
LCHYDCNIHQADFRFGTRDGKPPYRHTVECDEFLLRGRMSFADAAHSGLVLDFEQRCAQVLGPRGGAELFADQILNQDADKVFVGGARGSGGCFRR